jgi:hypothetical protein
VALLDAFRQRRRSSTNGEISGRTAKATGKDSDDGTLKRVWTAMGEGAKPLLEMHGNTSARTGKLTERGRELAAKLGLEA